MLRWGGLMADWVWDSLLLFLRIFLILSLFSIVGVAVAVLYAWWNQAEPAAAFTAAFVAVIVVGFAWFWWFM